jgi:FMN-dependent oxidoreductase (nitrilotriacetate monooxygenase family)
MDRQRAHDDRYDLADEYMDVVYKLWEGSWEDDAVVRDVANRVYARGDKVHEVSHVGPHFRVNAVHMSEPSPQRTPVLYQAGGSQRGRIFAAKHAECIFLSGLPKKQTAERVKEIRERARAVGRNPDHIKFIMMATVITAPTEAEARDKHADLSRYLDAEGMLALYSGLSGIDLSKEIAKTTGEVPTSNGIKTVVEYLLKENKSLERLKDITNFGPQGGRECFIVGSPTQVADELQAWVRDADIDGFNLQRSGEPRHLIDFIDLVVPELQNRGVYKREYRKGSFREKLFGAGDRIHAGHPAAKYRF